MTSYFFKKCLFINFAFLLLAPVASYCLEPNEMVYSLVDLKYTGFTWKKTSIPGQTIYYLSYENLQGQHTLVFDRYATGAENEDIEFLKSKVGDSTSRFSLEIHCKAKAFCVESCRKKYYEFSNASEGLTPVKSSIAMANSPPSEEKGIERNCKITQIQMSK